MILLFVLSHECMWLVNERLCFPVIRILIYSNQVVHVGQKLQQQTFHCFSLAL